MKTFERELPAGYHVTKTIDINNKKFNLKLSLAALALSLGLLVLSVTLIIHRYGAVEMYAGWAILIMVIYLALHELTHGIVYLVLTGQKLSFGVSLNSLYCGLPDVYTYRSTSLAAMLAPFVVYSIIFLLEMFLNSKPEWKLVFAVVFSCHAGGCIGDLYEAGLFIFRYTDPGYLMKDTGPVQTIYGRENDL